VRGPWAFLQVRVLVLQCVAVYMYVCVYRDAMEATRKWALGVSAGVSAGVAVCCGVYVCMYVQGCHGSDK